MHTRSSSRGRIRRLVQIVALSVVAAGFSALESAGLPPVGSWNQSGHQIVCQIAWTRITDEARARIEELLALDESYGEFAPSCVWADDVRARLRAGDSSVAHLARFTTAHYVNTPRGQSGIDAAACTQVGANGRSAQCVVDGIREVADSLLGGSTPVVRLEALKLLGHFVGDVHQPLHAGYGDDRGGNDFRVSIMGQPDGTLHVVWDVFFLEHGGRPWAELAADLAMRITPVDARRWASNDPVQWADESYQIVEREVYDGLDPDGAYVGQQYYDRHLATVERQLMKAGVRLAAILNELLDPDHRSSTLR